jgi:hypothetical protein
MRHPLVAAAAIFALGAGCQRSSEDALLIGRLFGDPSIGCVWIGGPRGGLEIDWPLVDDVDVEAVRVSGRGGGLRR